MSDRVLLTATAKNLRECIQLARECGLGIEIFAFSVPALLDGEWSAALDQHRALLAGLKGDLTLHGPFMDMAPGSLDGRINQICVERYQHAIRIAEALHVPVVVLHANFIASIHTETYRRGWQERNIVFWSQLAEYAGAHGVTLAVENMWEFDPFIIGDVVRTVNHPALRCCLDVGHAHLFSDTAFDDWVTALEPWLIHVHTNNNDGLIDVHRALGDGVVDYPRVLARLRALARPPTLTLEMDHVEDMRASLPLLQLPRSTPLPRRP